jgi:hypothetical protein
MTFEKQILPTCPKCGAPGLRVTENRKTKASIRRRKRCEVCGHRVTTHEISQEMFEGIKATNATLETIRKALDQVAEDSAAIECDDCKFSHKGRCGFDLPEYGTEDALNCNLFEVSRS